MKGRLISIGVLSSIVLAIAIVGWGFIIGGATNDPQFTNCHDNEALIAVGGGIVGFSLLGSIALIVMGTITLSTQKSEAATGLTITSGILAICGFIPLVNIAAIVTSFIAVSKISKANRNKG